MSNLNNMYNACPALMSDGRTSVQTDYRSKNDTFASMKGTSTNSYEFRDTLQKTGKSNITESNTINLCSTVPYGNIITPKEIKLIINETGNFKDAFRLIRQK